MFLNLNDLNESSNKNRLAETKIRGLFEGENPKSNNSKANQPGWQLAKSSACANSNWEKMRK